MLNVRVSPLKMAEDNLKNSRDEAYSDASTFSASRSSANEEWQKKVLAALQDSAPPEPIRLACMCPVPNKPFYFDEEFHGKITREKVTELLAGSSPANGRFLVRESLSAPGNYRLSLTFGGKVEHYRLFYSDGMFSAGEAESEKSYHKIVDLVVDILEMLRLVTDVEGGQVSEKKVNKPGSKPKDHSFKRYHYNQPKWCDICGKFMWGIKMQGFKCDTCGMNVHERCLTKDKRECKVPDPKEKPRIRKRISNAGSPRHFSISSETFKTQCDYQESCVRFLNYLNIPVSLFDVDALNPCYCDHCCQEIETPLYKNGDPPREYSMPMGWCRFQIAASDKPTVNTCTWNMAFMSLAAEDIIDVLENKFKTEPDSSGPEMPKPLTKLTPSIICADLDSSKLKYPDPETEEKRAGQVVVQVYIQPFSYRLMGRPGSVEEIDPYFKKDSIYWVTNQMSYVVPFALLVKTIDATYLQL